MTLLHKNCYPPAREVCREAAILTERKYPHTNVNYVVVYLVLSFLQL